MIKIIKNKHCNINEKMLRIKKIKLTRGNLNTLVETGRPVHRSIIDAYFAVLGKINKEKRMVSTECKS